MVWHDCQTCGLPWPFPTGLGVSGGVADRVWECTVCGNAVLAKVKRGLVELADKIVDVVESFE